MLAVLTGPVRSGKSAHALALAVATGKRVVIAAGGRASDPEMQRRIARHQVERAVEVEVVEASPEADWLRRVPDDACLVIDCLGTLLGPLFDGLVRADAACADEGAEVRIETAVGVIIEAIVARDGDTVVVTNEVGWGVVPATPAGRLFRDVLGRANRTVIQHSDAAWLVVGGRCIDLAGVPEEPAWPYR